MEIGSKSKHEQTDLIIRYRKRTGKSAQIYEMASKRLPSGNTRTGLFYLPYPSYIKKGMGSHIWDADGNELIDFCFNYSVLILGHRHPKVMQAVQEQLESGTVLGGPTELEVNLAEEIHSRMPVLEMLRFTASGTEAVMNAIRLARAATGKRKIVVSKGCFHGTSDSVQLDSAGVPKDVLSQTLIVPYGDSSALKDTLRDRRGEIAAVLLEPTLGTAGAISNREYLATVRELTKAEGTPLILDEIVTGFRLARGGAQEYFKVNPDIVTLGKIIGGGFPVGAFGASEELMSLYAFGSSSSLVPERPKISQSGTYNAHPISMAAGLATLRELSSDVYPRLNIQGESIRKDFSDAAREAGVRIQVTGTGSLFHLLFASEPVTDFDSASTADENLIRTLNLELLCRGIFFPPAHYCNISAVTSDDDIHAAAHAFGQSIAAIKPMVTEICPSLTSL